jgi:hypothetical protein
VSTQKHWSYHKRRRLIIRAVAGVTFIFNELTMGIDNLNRIPSDVEKRRKDQGVHSTQRVKLT